MGQELGARDEASMMSSKPNILLHGGKHAFLSPPVQIARWAHMHHFLSVRLSGLDQKSD